MKRYRYRGPGGEREVRVPLAIRMVHSTWFLLLWTLGFMGWGGYYLFAADPQVFRGQALSPEHREIAGDCVTCHVPFVGVPNESCTTSECHAKSYHNTIHNTLAGRCTDCHTMHTEGELIPVGITDGDCDHCHERLKADLGSIFHPDNFSRRKVTYVPRGIYRHRTHQFPPHYKCWQCHCIGDKTLNTPMQDLFKMESCLKCHERKGCHVCHQYHQAREARPRVKTCISEEFVPDLQFKTLGCTAYRSREPGFKGLVVCETGEPVISYGMNMPPEGAMPEPDEQE